MNELHKQIRRAQRRLATQRFLKVLGWCWLAALAFAAGLIVADRYYPLGLLPWAWAAGAVGVGIVAAVTWTWATAGKSLDAALEIDRRYALKERVSSTLALPAAERESEAGQALVADAVRRVARIDVAEKFRIGLPRQILLLLPGAAAVALALLWNSLAPEEVAKAGATETPAEQRSQVKKSSELLEKRLAEQRAKAEEKGLPPDATELLKKLEEGAKNLASEPKKENALVQLNKLTEQLKARRQELGGAEKIKQQLDQLKGVEKGPAEKLVQAMSRGNFEKAAQELQKLKDQLNNSKLDEKQKEELAKQMNQMEDKIRQMADARNAAMKDLQKQADQKRQAGQPGEANKLEEQLAKMTQQAPQMQQMQEMAKQLGDCAKCLREGDAQQAAQALGQMQEKMQQLQKDLNELEALDGAMDQVAQARDDMKKCGKCGGKGCEACQGDGEGQGMAMDGDGQGEKPGKGLGKGKGDGARPEQETDVAFYDSRVGQRVGKGGATIVGTAPGPNAKGRTEATIQQQLEMVRKGAADPVSGQRVPRNYSEHAREYFEKFEK